MSATPSSISTSPSPSPSSTFADCSCSPAGLELCPHRVRYHWDRLEQSCSERFRDLACFHCDRSTAQWAKESKSISSLASTALFDSAIRPLLTACEPAMVDAVRRARIHRSCERKLRAELRAAACAPVPALLTDLRRSWERLGVMFVRANRVALEFPELAAPFYSALAKWDYRPIHSTQIGGNVTQSTFASCGRFKSLIEPLIQAVLERYATSGAGARSDPGERELKEFAGHRTIELKRLSTPVGSPPQPPHLDSLDSDGVAAIVPLNARSRSGMFSMFRHRKAASGGSWARPLPLHYWRHFIQVQLDFGDLVIFRPTVVHFGPGNARGEATDAKGKAEPRRVLFAALDTRGARLNQSDGSQLWEFIDSGKTFDQVKRSVALLVKRFEIGHLRAIVEEMRGGAERGVEEERRAIARRCPKSRTKNDQRMRRSEEERHKWRRVGRWMERKYGM